MAFLTAGDRDAAWDALITHYRRLIFAAIRRTTSDADHVMDVFAAVCETLRADDCRRLRDYAARARPGSKFSTWLCAVVHNRAIDCLREREGRPRPSAAAGRMPPLQRHIYERVFLQQRSHVEAYELLRSDTFPTLAFGSFLAALRDVYRAVGRETPLATPFATRDESIPETLSGLEPHAGPSLDPSVAAEREAVLTEAMASLPVDDRLAVQLYVVEGMPATDVARAVGLSGAKAVYNRVYRALAALRERLQRAGVGAGDL
ncbi:MAG TPA: sigma-70 family RNA polymerase sigma factor [Gemmatimonadaceae bacterium]|nr:sigma-70 family RNA polymerase sigma factor [Gemmatimonadaceae bacterium]